MSKVGASFILCTALSPPSVAWTPRTFGRVFRIFLRIDQSQAGRGLPCCPAVCPTAIAPALIVQSYQQDEVV